MGRCEGERGVERMKKENMKGELVEAEVKAEGGEAGEATVAYRGKPFAYSKGRRLGSYKIRMRRLVVARKKFVREKISMILFLCK